MANQTSECEPSPECPVPIGRRRSVVVRAVALVAWVAAIGLPLSLIAAWCVGFIGSGSLVLGFLALMVQTFAFHAGLAAGVLLLVVLGMRRWRPALALSVGVLVTLGPVGLRFVSRPSVEPMDDAATLTVLSCNLLVGTARPEPLLAWIDKVSPDVILLQEYGHSWTGVVRDSLLPRYPHVWQEPGGAHGQAIISRLPFEAIEDDVFEQRWKVPAPRASLIHEGRSVDITNVHVYPPMRMDLLAAQNNQLDTLREESARRLQQGETAVLLMGDFNASWNTNQLRPFAGIGLNEAHAQVGIGRGSTWGPRHGLMARAPGIRIDQAVYGGGLEPIWSAVGPDVSSDHRPIAVGFRWRDPD